MTRTTPTRMLTIAAAAMLACVLGLLAFAPQGAYAAESSDMPLTTQATAKKSMYVRTSAGDWKYSYKNGLVTAIKGKNETWTFKYSGAKMVSATKKTKYSTTTTTAKLTLSYDAKGRVKKITNTGPNSTDNYTQVFSYNKKNQVTKMVKKNTSSNATETYKYKYNSKGLVVKSTSPIGTTVRIFWGSAKDDPLGKPMPAYVGYWSRNYDPTDPTI